MPVRSTMANLIAKVRIMLADPVSASQQFDDQTLQDSLDEYRTDQRYLPLQIAPSIVNTASTNHIPSTIYADYYAPVQWWESDAVLQGQDSSGNAWIVLTPTDSDYLVGHWTFESNVFTSGTVPGQLPPVWVTGKTYDLFSSAADLLEFWAASLTCAYDINVDGQSLRRSQLMQAKLTLAASYRRRAKPHVGKMIRHDVNPELSTRSVRLLDSDDVFMGM